MNYKKILDEVYAESLEKNIKGVVSTTIPELEKIDPIKFGIHITTINKDDYGVGDSEERFSIQSVSKILSVALAFSILGEKIWKRVGVEPSGNAFNSLIQLEYEQGIPRNPFINAGALVIADILVSVLENPKEDFLNFVQKIAHSKSINFNEKVAQSEKNTSFRNAALVNFIKSFGNIDNDVNQVLDFYFYQCSIEMSCKELAHAFYLFANEGLTLQNDLILTVSEVKRLNALMQTCGLYDESGEFTYRVGLPAKSGIGGGIVAVMPQKFSIATWSPRLNKKGNSEQSIYALEKFTTKTGMSVF